MTAETSQFDLAGKQIWVAGHAGMVGSAILRRLQRENCTLITAELSSLDLRRQREVEDWFAEFKPAVVILAAAKVGGILANNTWPAEFIYDNLVIETNVIEAARRTGVAKFMLLGSSCIYPKLAPQPLVEEALLTGPLEPTNEWYAMAKIAGIKLCQAYRRQYGCDFISVMPTNLYGPGDNFSLESSHVVPALMRKFHEAKERGDTEVIAWGTGTPRRELLHVDDMADACIHLMKVYSAEGHVNIGTGRDLTIKELVQLVKDVVGYEGRVRFDASKPDGTPQKLLDVTRLHTLGWRYRIELASGLAQTYDWFKTHLTRARL